MFPIQLKMEIFDAYNTPDYHTAEQSNYTHLYKGQGFPFTFQHEVKRSFHFNWGGDGEDAVEDS